MRLWWSGVTLLVSATGLVAQGTTGAAPPVRRSTVLVRPPASIAREPELTATRPPSAVSAAAAPSVVATPTRTPSLVTAAARVQAQPAPGTGATATVRVPEAATALARHYYGARTARVAVRDARSVTVFLRDSARLEPAPPGLGVADGVALPVRFLTVDSASGDVMALKPWLDDGGGLRFDSRRNAYVATLRMGVRDTLNARRPRALAPPVRFSVVAAADSVLPERIEIGETNVFTTSARVVTTRRDRAVRVSVWPDFADHGIDVWIPYRMDTLLVRVDRGRIDGLGLEDATVTVSVPAGALAPTDSVAVTLSTSRGRLTTQTLYPKGGTPASTTLHSDGLGDVTLSAQAATLVEGTTTLSFGLPTGLLWGGLIGALMGSGLVLTRERRRSRRGVPWVVGSGVLAGLVVAVIVAIGAIKLPGFDIPTGSGFFIALLGGVLGGYVGPKGLEALVPAMKAGREPTPAG